MAQCAETMNPEYIAGEWIFAKDIWTFQILQLYSHMTSVHYE